MNTKLTLTIEQAVIEKAKQYAKRKNRSLSDLIQSYLTAITMENEKPARIESPIVRSLKGSFKMPEGFDYKNELTKSLSEKYQSK